MEKLGSGIAELDTLLGGGIERGTSTLIVGAPGSGKSTLAAQFVVSAADQGQNAALFIFDESLNTLLTRTAGLGIDIRKHIDAAESRCSRSIPPSCPLASLLTPSVALSSSGIRRSW